MPYRPDPDEGPSEADQDRFGDDRASTGYCPDCGAEVFEDTEVCPRCFAFIGDQVRATPRPRGLWREHWKRLLAVVLILALLGIGALVAKLAM